jgi:hypothetical protein
MVGLPTVDEFPLLGCLLGNKYCTSHWNKMYEAFTCPNGCAIHLEELLELDANSNEATVLIMVDHLGCTQHTIGSVDHAKASNNWSKGAVMGGEGVDHPTVGKGWEGSARGMGMGGKRQQHEAGANAEELSSDVEDERARRRRRKSQPSKKSTSTIPNEWDKSPTPPISPNSLICGQLNQSSLPAPTTTSAPSHVTGTRPLINSWVAHLCGMSTLMTNLAATSFNVGMSLPIQTLAESSVSSISTPNSTFNITSSGSSGLPIPHSNPNLNFELDEADLDALQRNLAMWSAENGETHGLF